MKKICCLLAILALASSQRKANAGYETPVAGAAAVATGTDVAIPAGTILNSITNTISGSASGFQYTAVVTEYVLQESTPAQHLDFLYQISSASSSTDFLTEISATAYLGFTANMANSDGSNDPTSNHGTVSATSVSRSGTGDSVNFFFSPNIAGGHTSKWLIINTNAIAYIVDNTGVHDGVETNTPGYAPAFGQAGQLVPVPPSWVLVMTAMPFLGLWVMVRRIARVKANLAS